MIKITNLKYITNIKYKYLSSAHYYHFFYVITETKMNQITQVINFLKLFNIEYQFVNNFTMAMSKSMSANMDFMKSPYLIIYCNDLAIINKIQFIFCKLVFVNYLGHFVNSNFISNLFPLENFHLQNYLFFISYLLISLTVLFNILLHIKHVTILQISSLTSKLKELN